MKGHNWGQCALCGKIHTHPKGMLGKTHSTITRLKMSKIQKVVQNRPDLVALHRALMIAHPNPNYKGKPSYTREVAKLVIDTFLNLTITPLEISRQFGLSVDIVYSILKNNIDKDTYRKRVKESLFKMQSERGKTHKGKTVSEDTREKLRNNPNIIEAGKRVQREYWLNHPEKRSELGGIFYSRAKSGHSNTIYDSQEEQIIGEFLQSKNLNFILHPKLKVDWHTYYPDFLIPELNFLYVEYFGSLWYKPNEKRTSEKIRSYNENNINWIAIYPKDLDSIRRGIYELNTSIRHIS